MIKDGKSKVQTYGYQRVYRHEIRALQSIRLAVLEEADCVGVLTEAATAHMQAILADQAAAHTADTAFTRSLAIFTGMAVPDIRVSHGRDNATVQGSQIDAETESKFTVKRNGCMGKIL